MGKKGRECIARDFSPESYRQLFAELFRSLARVVQVLWIY